MCDNRKKMIARFYPVKLVLILGKVECFICDIHLGFYLCFTIFFYLLILFICYVLVVLLVLISRYKDIGTMMRSFGDKCRNEYFIYLYISLIYIGCSSVQALYSQRTLLMMSMYNNEQLLPG